MDSQLTVNTVAGAAGKVIEKGKLERGAIKQTVNGASLTFELLHDYDKFSNGSIMMNATNATFKIGEEEGRIGMDMGGTKVEVCIGKRSWVLDVKEIVNHCLSGDEAYQKGTWDGHEG